MFSATSWREFRVGRTGPRHFADPR